ncbi:MAG TPA: hypothetical protein DIT76_02920 [Spartobacteria bacterium]|jgi:hypothetical protein|nr:hypothetical protein [Spartobacteria bacterium]HCP90993.1 hypothetical protein [Spartobacteria bacterium]
MPTSFLEWAALIGTSLAAGIVCGLLFRRFRWLVTSLIFLQVIAAPVIYYTPPILSGSKLAEYHAWSFLIIPMLAAQSFAISLVSACLVRRVRRLLYTRRQNI